MISKETKAALLLLRRKLQAKAEKEEAFAVRMAPGSARRERQIGVALGFERAARDVEQELMELPQ